MIFESCHDVLHMCQGYLRRHTHHYLNINQHFYYIVQCSVLSILLKRAHKFRDRKNVVHELNGAVYHLSLIHI